PLPTRVFVTGSLILMCALATGWYMKDNRLKAADFGVSWQDWRQHAFEALKLSLPVMVGVVVLKGWMLNLRGESDQALFQPGLAFEHFSWPLFAAVLMATVILSLAQEFVVRSGIQGSLQIFYSEDRFSFPWQPIVVSNLLFAATYAHLSPLWAAAVFFPGLFWGWLFARQHSLVGVSVSHTLISIWAMLVVGFPTSL
ncbi:MAG: CPBP family glutamic-type intramembrane protease, partial [Candidatus Sericytochromatia bacterium]